MSKVWLALGLLALCAAGGVTAQNEQKVSTETENLPHVVYVMSHDFAEAVKERAEAMESMIGRRAGMFHHRGKPRTEHAFEHHNSAVAQSTASEVFPGVGIRAEPLKTKEEPHTVATSKALPLKAVDLSDSDSDSESDSEDKEAVSVTKKALPVKDASMTNGDAKDASEEASDAHRRHRHHGFKHERDFHHGEHGPHFRHHHGFHSRRPCLFRRAKHWFKHMLHFHHGHHQRFHHGHHPEHDVPEHHVTEGVHHYGEMASMEPARMHPPSAAEALAALMVVFVPLVVLSALVFHGVRALVRRGQQSAPPTGQFLTAPNGLVYAAEHTYQPLPAKEVA